MHQTIGVDRVYFNSDPSKDDRRSWKAFREALRIARIKKGLTAHTSLTMSETGSLDQGEIRIEVLFPPPDVAATRPGGLDLDGAEISSNSMSVAIMLRKHDKPQVFLAGDVEFSCLDHLVEEESTVTAPVLVFPHHGGNPGSGNPVLMAERLCSLVQPRTVLFSMHRSQYGLPLPGVIDTIRRVCPDTRIACTQLSSRCAKDLPKSGGTHLLDLPSRGSEERACCAGTIVIDLSGAEPMLSPQAVDHRAFITTFVPNAMCIRS